MEKWFAFKAFNSQVQYGFGTAKDAELYADHLNEGREINLYSANEITAEEALEKDLEGRSDSFNIGEC